MREHDSETSTANVRVHEKPVGISSMQRRTTRQPNARAGPQHFQKPSLDRRTIHPEIHYRFEGIRGALLKREGPVVVNGQFKFCSAIITAFPCFLSHPRCWQ